MILGINTIKNNNTQIEISLYDGKKLLISKNIKAEYRQAEKLLVGIDKIFESRGIQIDQLKGIKVENSGGSFTSLRIGVVTANALGFALGIPVMPWNGESGDKVKYSYSGRLSMVKAQYDAEPNITISKKQINKYSL